MNDAAELHTPPLNKIGLPEGMNFRQRMDDWLMHARGNRRRAHDYKRWAMEYLATGNERRFYECKAASDRSWRLAWNAITEAKLSRELANV